MTYCKWCDDGHEPKMLDEDGVLCELSGQPGRMRHAYEDYTWLCKNYTRKGNRRTGSPDRAEQ